jgi:hypothetical protein
MLATFRPSKVIFDFKSTHPSTALINETTETLSTRSLKSVLYPHHHQQLLSCEAATKEMFGGELLASTLKNKTPKHFRFLNQRACTHGDGNGGANSSSSLRTLWWQKWTMGKSSVL